VNKGSRLFEWTKKLTGRPTITVGAVGLDAEFISFFTEGKGAENVNIDGLIERLEREEFDLVAVGRALLVDPAWAEKIRYGCVEVLVPFTAEASKTLF